MAIAAIASLIFIAHLLYLRHFSIDDAAISYRFSEHLAQGQGLTWNPGQPPVEGYSNFLWVLILALSRFVGLDIVGTSKILGVLLGFASLYGITTLSFRMWSKNFYWWVPPILVAVTPEWTAWAVSGLEIALYGALLILGLIAIGRSDARGTVYLSLSVVGLALTRPEGAGIGLLLIAASSFRNPEPVGARARVMMIAVPLAVLVFVSLGVAVFRLWYFGHPLPNTVYAKFETSMPSAGRVLIWAIYCAPFLIGTVWARDKLESRYQRAIVYTCAALGTAQMMVVLPVSPVMYFLHRYQIAFLPLVVLSVPVFLAKIADLRRGAVPYIACALILWCAQGWPKVVDRYDFEKYILERQACIVERLRILPDRPTIALQDAGRIPYWTDLPAIDAWGLCDEEFARRGFSPDLVLARRPDVYLLSLHFDREPGVEGIRMGPHIGMDIITGKMPSFRKNYGLWQVCKSEGETPEVGDTTALYYDYGVFLNVEWAKQKGLDQQLRFVKWE